MTSMQQMSPLAQFAFASQETATPAHAPPAAMQVVVGGPPSVGASQHSFAGTAHGVLPHVTELPAPLLVATLLAALLATLLAALLPELFIGMLLAALLSRAAVVGDAAVVGVDARIGRRGRRAARAVNQEKAGREGNGRSTEQPGTGHKRTSRPRMVAPLAGD